ASSGAPDACTDPGAERVFSRPVRGVRPGARRFGRLVLNPRAEEFRSYRGQEYPMPAGRKVRAAADGRVFYTRVNGSLAKDGFPGRGYGRLIKIRHGCGVSTRYAHLRKFLVKEGDYVKRGQVIALSGNSGGSHQPHLHIEVLVEGRPLDPAVAYGASVGTVAWIHHHRKKEPLLLAPLVHVAPGRRGFGRRLHPLTKRYADHQGQDYSARPGTPIRAAADGLVYYARVSGSLAQKGKPGRGYGRLVKLRHAHGVSTRYAHLQRFRVRRGQRVRQGQIIGYVGNTGGSTGPHLHFEVRVEGRAVDPLEALGRPLSVIGQACEEVEEVASAGPEASVELAQGNARTSPRGGGIPRSTLALAAPVPESSGRVGVASPHDLAQASGGRP
ncbi:MAG: peptidoglycan DD-metalloendopeptidase family protein, partial [Myxococcota bacterium]